MPIPPSPRRDVSVAISGSGGAGTITAGGLLLQAAADAGWYGLLTRTVGPQIRGGEAAAIVRLSNRPVSAAADRCDVLFAIDWLNIDRLIAEIPLASASLVVADAESGELPDVIAASGARVLRLPFADLLASIEGGRANMLAVGYLASLIGLPDKALERVIDDVIGKKGMAATAASRAGARAGYDAGRGSGETLNLAPCAERGDRWLITGNEATGLGALRGGVRFVAAYPITPATEILEWMSPALAKVGGNLVQAEDELSSINMIIGASYGGVPALTATSGPGFALMTEAIGLATASETPIIVVDVMRGGPSTGIPTKSEQSDLNIAIYGLHGDAPHIVVAPTSIADCTFTAHWAVHLAEAMQVPVVVLSDQFLGQSRAIIDKPADIAFITRREIATEFAADGYDRYAVTASGISPMALPGIRGGQYTADGLTHSQRGMPSTRASDHHAQLDKRLRKIASFDYGDHWAEIEGEGKLAVITWGSVAGAAREALDIARENGVAARLIALRLLAPARPSALADALSGVERVLVVEQTHSAQFYRYLRAEYELPAETAVLNRAGPLPLRPAEILEHLMKGF
jgi:2-oxoglutarate ferredoxin oxidoreductase subunit alpha